MCSSDLAGHSVEVAIARGKENNRQHCGERAQLAAQREAAIDIRAQADVDEREIRQAGAHCGQRFGASGIGRDFEAVLAQRLSVVGTNGRLVLDDGDAARHGGDYSRRQGVPSPVPALCQNCSALCPRLGRKAPPVRSSIGYMESQQAKRPALPLLALLAMASALGVAVAIALAGVTMLLAAPAYAGEGSLLLERRGAMAEAKRLSAEVESQEDGEAVMTRVVEVYHNPFEERLVGMYLYRLPHNVALERVSFTPASAEPHYAVLRRRNGAALIEPTEALGSGETLVVELVYRTRSVRRLLALR